MILERKSQPNLTPIYVGPVDPSNPKPVTMLMAPPIDEDYWLFRVKLSKKQSIVGFPKYNTIGIGFAVE